MTQFDTISNNSQTKALQHLATITPVQEEKKTSSIDQDQYRSDFEQTLETDETFWEKLLAFCIKIFFIKNFTLALWRLGVRALQPSRPIKHKHFLLFNSSIEIPKWFNEEMQYQASLTLCRHLLTEIKMVQEKAPISLNTMMRLSQVSVSQELYHYPDIIEKLEQALQDLTLTVIRKIQQKYSDNLLDIHLGDRSCENPLLRKPLTGLFIQAFINCLKTYKPSIHSLYIHGPCNNSDALKILLTELHSRTLLDLHLHFDETTSKKAFELLGKTLKQNPALRELVFCNQTPSCTFWMLDEYWLELATSINSHQRPITLSFYNLPEPPEIFRTALSNRCQIEPLISLQQGFCIKKA